MPETQRFTYHCHSNFSDGSNSIEEICCYAQKLGFTEIGISDHLMVHKNMRKSISWPVWQQKAHSDIFYTDFKKILPKYQQHCENIRSISKKIGMKMYVGFEVDFFTYDGWLEEFKEFISELDYDYLISGNHMLFLQDCENIIEIGHAGNILNDIGLAREYIQNHFSVIEAAIKSGLFAFIAHLDYVRKVGQKLYQECEYTTNQQRIARILNQNDVATEISTKGLRKSDCFYPSLNWLKYLADEKVKMVISDDAHRLSEIGYRFDFAEETLEKLGSDKRFKF